MPKFFSHILKHKKIIIFLLLVLVVAGVFIPQNASAISWACALSPGACILSEVFSGRASNDAIAKIVNLALKNIIGILAIIPIALSGFFSFLGGSLLRMVLELSTNGVIYTSLDPKLSPAISTGWPIARNFGNMIIVLALITIALATIIRYEAYEAKKLLPKLIVAALLINFSLVICGVVIDASNIAMKYTLSGGQPIGTHAADFVSKTESNAAKELYERFTDEKEDSFGLFFRIAGIVFFFVMKGIISFIFVFLFLFRIFALWILVILSPLAFACYVLPFTRKKVFEPWLDTFIQWCFIGIFAALFIYIGDAINTKIGTLPAFQPVLNGPIAALSGVFQFFIPGMFLLIGFLFSMKLSVMGSGMAIGGGKWVKNQVVGAGKWAKNQGIGLGKFGAQQAYDKSGAKSGLQEARNFATQKLENAGLLRTGYTNDRRSKQQAETAKDNRAKERSASLPFDQQLAMAIKPAGLGSTGRDDKMANMDAVVNKGRGYMLSEQDLLWHASQTGKTDILSRAGSATAHLDTDKIAELKLQNKREGGETRATYNNRIIKMARSAARVNMPEDKELKGLDDQAKAHRIIASGGGIDPATGQLRHRVSDEGITLIEGMAEDGNLGKLAKVMEELASRTGHTIDGIEAVSGQMNEMAKRVGSTVFKDAKKKDFRFADKDDQAIEERAQKIAGPAQPILANHRTDAKQELKDEAHAKISGSYIAKDMDDSLIDVEFIKNKGITARTIGQAMNDRNMTSKKIDKIQKAVDELVAQANTASQAGNTALADELINKAIEIHDVLPKKP